MQEYTYLGKKKNESGNQNTEIEHRITQAPKAFNSIWGIHIQHEIEKLIHMKH
jgi:hypothetical protein